MSSIRRILVHLCVTLFGKARGGEAVAGWWSSFSSHLQVHKWRIRSRVGEEYGGPHPRKPRRNHSCDDEVLLFSNVACEKSSAEEEEKSGGPDNEVWCGLCSGVPNPVFMSDSEEAAPFLSSIRGKYWVTFKFTRKSRPLTGTRYRP
jgi:hypothetical protein